MKNTIYIKTHSIFDNSGNHLLVFNTIFILSFFLCTFQVSAGDTYISTKSGKDFFQLVADGKSAPLYVSSQDHLGVLRIVKHLLTRTGIIFKQNSN